MEAIVNAKLLQFNKVIEATNQNIRTAESKLETACDTIEKSTIQRLND